MKQVVVPLDTRTELKKSLDKIQSELSAEIEFIQLKSKMLKEQYDSLLKEGFSESQAMQFILAHPVCK